MHVHAPCMPRCMLLLLRFLPITKAPPCEASYFFIIIFFLKHFFGHMPIFPAFFLARIPPYIAELILYFISNWRPFVFIWKQTRYTYGCFKWKKCILFPDCPLFPASIASYLATGIFKIHYFVIKNTLWSYCYLLTPFFKAMNNMKFIFIFRFPQLSVLIFFIKSELQTMILLLLVMEEKQPRTMDTPHHKGTLVINNITPVFASSPLQSQAHAQAASIMIKWQPPNEL